MKKRGSIECQWSEAVNKSAITINLKSGRAQTFLRALYGHLAREVFARQLSLLRQIEGLTRWLFCFQ
jgi:hypothetical protein